MIELCCSKFSEDTPATADVIVADVAMVIPDRTDSASSSLYDDWAYLLPLLPPPSSPPALFRAATLRMLGLDTLFWMCRSSHAFLRASAVSRKWEMYFASMASSTFMTSLERMYLNVSSYTEDACRSSAKVSTMLLHSAYVFWFSLLEVYRCRTLLLLKPSMLLSSSCLHESEKLSLLALPTICAAMAECMQYRGGYCCCRSLSGILRSPKSRNCISCSHTSLSPSRFVFLADFPLRYELREDDELDADAAAAALATARFSSVGYSSFGRSDVAEMADPETYSQSMNVSLSSASYTARLSTNLRHTTMHALTASERLSFRLMVARSHRVRRAEMAATFASETGEAAGVDAFISLFKRKMH